MLRIVTALSAVLIMGWAFVGSATDANAGYRGHGCCGPIPPSYTYNTKKVHKYIRHHRDVHRTKYFTRIKRIVHVKRIQPIIHVHTVTRVHTKLVGVVKTTHHPVTKWLPAKKYYTSKVVYLRPQCGCSSHGHY
jgi:hypothetical protein